VARRTKSSRRTRAPRGIASALALQLRPIKQQARTLVTWIRRDQATLERLRQKLRAQKEARRIAADPPLTPALEQLVQQANALLKSARHNLYSLGTLYGSLVDNQIAQKAGFRNAEEFWVRHIPTDVIGIRYVQLWGRIGAYFSVGVTSLYSPNCLDLLLRYGTRFAVEIPADPGDLLIVKDHFGKRDGKKFRDCTEADMKDFLKGPPGEPPMAPSEFADFRDAVRAVSKKIEVTWRNDKKEQLFYAVNTDAWTWPNLVLGLVAWAKKHTIDPDHPIPPGWPGGS
jgi:hypothetical protein